MNKSNGILAASPQFVIKNDRADRKFPVLSVDGFIMVCQKMGIYHRTTIFIGTAIHDG